MKIFKSFVNFSLLGMLLFSLSCDDRLPSEPGATIEKGSLELSYVFVNKTTSNPTIVGEILSDADAKTSIVVIARFLDEDGNGVNDKSLQFSADVAGDFDTSDPSTKYVPNFKKFGFPDLGGDGYTYAMFTPANGIEKIKTAAQSGAFITVKYSSTISDDVEFSIFSSKDQVWPYTMNITASEQVDLGATSNFEVLLQNAYGQELSGVLLNIESANGNILCADTCYTDVTGRVNTTFESYSFSENVGTGIVNTSFYHPEIKDTLTVSKQILIGNVETGLLELSYVFVNGTTSNPTIVGEVLSASDAKTSIIVIARLLDEDGNGVNDKSLQFSADVSGGFDTSDPSTQYVPNFSEFGLPNLGGNGFAYAMFTPEDGVERIETIAQSGAMITVEYTPEIKNNVEFSIFSSKDQVWPYTMNITASEQVDLGATSNFEVLLQNAYGQELSGVLLNIESANGNILCADTCYTDVTGRVNTTFESYSFSENVGRGTVSTSFYHPQIGDTLTVPKQILIGTTETGLLELSYVFVNGTTSNPTIVGEVLSDPDAKTSIVVISRLLDEEGNGVNGKSLQFSADVSGTFDTSDPSTQYVSNFSEFGLPNLGGDGYAYVMFTPEDGVERIETIAQSGAIITVEYTPEIIDYVEFSVFSSKDQVWPYTMNITASEQIDLGATSTFEVLLQNAYGHELSGVLLNIESDNGTITCANACYTDETGRINTEFESYSYSENVGPGTVSTSFYHPEIRDTLTVSKQILIGTTETGSLELSYVFVNRTTSNPTIVGEVLSDPDAKTSVIVIARLLDEDGNGVNGKSLQFSADVSGTFDTSDPYTQYVANFDEFGLPDLGGNGCAYAMFTPEDGVERIETAAQSGAIITVEYTPEIKDNVEFSIFSSKDQVWPYTMNIAASSQIDLGATSTFEVLLQNAYGHELSGVLLNIESDNGTITCANACYTDETGRINTEFESYSFSENVGPGTVNTSFYHPEIQDTITVPKQIIIGTESGVGSCSYIEIPSSNPSEIVVQDGGGIESTDIKAEVYDNNGNLLTSPVTVNFKLEPVLSGTYLNSPGQTTVDVETVNGIATVSLNSGSEPGPVRIIATTNTIETSVCDSLNDALESITVPVVVASGAPYYIEAEYDPNSTQAIGGGFYQTECAAIVYDRWYNPVEDSTYVYWNINPLPPDTLIDAFVEGVSYTNNEGILSGIATSGVARSNIVYSTDAIGDIGQVRALTFGANGDSVASFINEGEGDATLFFLPGQVSLLSSASYWDFSLQGSPASIVVSALVIDFYGNPVADAPIAFGGIGVSSWNELKFEAHDDVGVDGFGANDGCFTWRDYGADNNPETLDMGTFNQIHDSFDTTGSGQWDVAEVSEPFEDFGVDNIPDTFDEGEGNGYWDGYSMINCEPVVRTDQDGYARIIVNFVQDICILANVDDTQDPNICSYDDFTASLSATLLIPEITTSDPLDILLVRSPNVCD